MLTRMRMPRPIAALALVLPGAAIAAPPPPPLVPNALKQPIEGYDVAQLYSIWHHWVEAQKGAVTEQLVSDAGAVEDHNSSAPILRFRTFNDYGHYLTGEITRHCRLAQGQRSDPADCHFRLRRAYVPLEVTSFGKDNAVSRWAFRSFDGPKLVAHLKSSGFQPATDWWRADRAKLFASLPSAKQVLSESGTVVKLDSRECPAMADAVAGLDKVRVQWRLDIAGVGDDVRLDPPLPHSNRTEHSLFIALPSDGMRATISGVSRTLDELVDPILTAADTCEAKRKATS